MNAAKHANERSGKRAGKEAGNMIMAASPSHLKLKGRQAGKHRSAVEEVHKG